MVSACKGMVYLQKRGVIHCDLSARNLLVSLLDGKYEVKVADFGLSRKSDENQADSSMVPIRWYISSYF
jgi:serine/threonine protein kinase